MRASSRHASVPEPWRFRCSRLARSVVGALRTRYPRYLFGLPPAADEIPVFHFHDVEADTFARQLGAERFMDWEQLRQCIASGLVDVASRRAAFEEHLGLAPRALTYPWTLGSALSLDAARHCGIRCVFGVATDFRRARVISRAGGQICAYGRIRGDWLELLPGRNRARLLPVLAHKVAARAGQQHLAH